MNQIFLISLAVVTACSLLLAVLALVSARKNTLKNKELEDIVDVISRKVEVLEDSAVGVGKRLHEFESQILDLQLETQQELEPASEDAILKAEGLLVQGKSIAEIASECQLPEHEVQLMQAVRRSKSVTLTPEVSD